MNKILSYACLGLLIAASAQAMEQHNPNRIRESFAMSGDAKLQLAADALGDDQLVNLLEELKGDKNLDPKIQKLIKRLK